MPLYDFQCESKHDFEVLAPKPPKRKKCPTCGAWAKHIFKRLAQYHNRYSPMHPKRMAGRR